jgi:hypothetical protein
VVRTYVAGFLGDCPVTDDVVLISSELAANAVMHSASQATALGGWSALG